jgi:polyisoprenoid-binding protein YceI
VLRFESVRIIQEKDQFLVEGNLTLKGISKLIRLDMEIGGVANDPWGNRKAGITLSGKINRKDFGLSFHVLNEAGNLLVSDDIKIICEVQLIAAAE